MADNVVADAGSGGATFVTAAFTWSGDTAHATGGFHGILTGSEGSWTFSPIVGGAGAVAAGVQRVTLASDDPAVALLATIDADTSAMVTDLAALETLVTAGNVDLAAIETLITAGNVDLAALETLVTAGNVDLAALETLVTAGNVDLAALEVLLAVGTGVMASAQAVTLATDDTQFGAVGAAADPDGNIHGQLRSIAENTDALPAALGSGAASGALLVTLPTTGDSVFGDLGDAASATGSVNAKLRIIYDTLATIDADTGAIKTAVELLDNAVDGNYLNVNANIAGTDMVGGAGAVAAGVQRITLASDDPAVVDLAAIEVLLGTIDADTGAIKTAVELMDTVGGGTEAAALRVTIANDSTGLVSVDDNSGSLTTDIPAVTSGGCSYFKSIDLDESEEEVKGSAGQLYGGIVMNMKATPLYLKIYNATAANVTVGTTVPDLTIPIPSAGDTSGAGFTIPIPAQGIAFSTAITVAATTGVADNDSGAPGANECVVALWYK